MNIFFRILIFQGDMGDLNKSITDREIDRRTFDIIYWREIHYCDNGVFKEWR